MSNSTLTDCASEGHELGDARMKYYDPLRVLTTVESYLKPLSLSSFSPFTRRVGLVDIEEITPLKEGTLPYNFAEVQRQVGNMKTR